MGEIFPEVVKQADVVRTTLTQEEESFFRTLERGIQRFEGVVMWQGLDSKGYVGNQVIEEMPPSRVFPGADAFELYDTYGFPLDLTELMARERGMSVNVAHFDFLMNEQRARAKAAQKKEVVTVKGEEFDSIRPTVFYGFSELQSASLVVANSEGNLVTAETPFYAEMGGQVGDAGEIEIDGENVLVTNTVKSKSGKVYFHRLASPVTAEPGRGWYCAWMSRGAAASKATIPARTFCIGRCARCWGRRLGRRDLMWGRTGCGLIFRMGRR